MSENSSKGCFPGKTKLILYFSWKTSGIPKQKEKVIRKNTFKDRRKAIIAKISKLRTGPPHIPRIEILTSYVFHSSILRFLAYI